MNMYIMSYSNSAVDSPTPTKSSVTPSPVTPVIMGGGSDRRDRGRSLSGKRLVEASGIVHMYMYMYMYMYIYMYIYIYIYICHSWLDICNVYVCG